MNCKKNDSVIKSISNVEKLINSIIGKIDEILNSQQRIEKLIQSVSQNNCSGNKTEVNFENTKADESEISKLKSECEDLIARNQLLKNENLKIKEENNSLKRQYSVFDKQIKILDSIKLLNDENKEYLEKLCGSVSAMSILSLGRETGKVEQLWYYLRDLVVKGKQTAEQIGILAKYFEFCIDLSNECKVNEEKYCMFDVEPGNEFDMDMCIRSAGSKQIGTVSETIVRGIKVGEKVRFQAIVSVK